MQDIYNALKREGLCDNGIYGLMGNLYAESGFRSNNMQNCFEDKLGFTDSTYTKAVDNEEYLIFALDGVGYGLAQWTYRTRKQKLLAFAKQRGCSIGDKQMQIDFLIQELQQNYPIVWKALKRSRSIREASDIVLTKYERPSDQSERVKEQRAIYGEKIRRKLTKDENVSRETLKDNITIAKEVISGKWGVGNDRKERLTKSGYNYQQIQRYVNKLLK